MLKDKLKLIKQHKKEWDATRLIATLKDPKDMTSMEKWALQEQRCGNCEDFNEEEFVCNLTIDGEHISGREFCSPYSLCECFFRK